MSGKMRIVVITAEGEGVAAAIQQIALLAGGVELAPSPPPAPPFIDTKRLIAEKAGPIARSDARARDAAILEAVKFRPLRVPEIADAICRNKQEDVPLTIQRLYPALARLVKQRRLVKKGREYSAR